VVLAHRRFRRVSIGGIVYALGFQQWENSFWV
jgi:hypothetical protein